MRFFTALATFGLVALASAQTSRTVEASNSTVVSSTRSESAPAATSTSAEARCLAACGAADICCQAACVNVPCPSQTQANQTTECAAKCPQGNGTKEDTSSYASCQASCISSYFFTTTAGGAEATGTAAGSGSAASTTAAGTGIGGSASTGASASGSSTASATGASSTGNAASNLKSQIAGAGLLGLIIAGLAL